MNTGLAYAVKHIQKGLTLLAMSLSVSAVASDTVYSWRGEKSFVWRDVTNTAACAVLVSPSS